MTFDHNKHKQIRRHNATNQYFTSQRIKLYHELSRKKRMNIQPITYYTAQNHISDMKYNPPPPTPTPRQKGWANKPKDGKTCNDKPIHKT
jgi:hypothetical protein